MATLRLSTKFRNLLLDPTAGKSWGEILKDGVIYLYSGGMPSSADAVETGTLLAKITLDGGAFTFGTTTNGLNFQTAASAAIEKSSSVTWKGDGLSTGEVGWGRFHENDGATGASTDKARMDFDVALSGAVYNMSDTTCTLGAPVIMTNAKIELPELITF